MSEAYSELYQRTKMECFVNMFNAKRPVNYFHEMLDLRCLTFSSSSLDFCGS